LFAKVLTKVLVARSRPKSVLTFVLFVITIGFRDDTDEERSVKFDVKLPRPVELLMASVVVVLTTVLRPLKLVVKVVSPVLVARSKPNSVLTFVLFATTIGFSDDTALDKSLNPPAPPATSELIVDCCDETTEDRPPKFPVKLLRPVLFVAANVVVVESAVLMPETTVLRAAMLLVFVDTTDDTP
jgi:hypothetical protein